MTHDSFSLVTKSNKPNMINYRYAPGGLWLEGIENFHKAKWIAMVTQLVRTGLVIPSPLFFPGHNTTNQGGPSPPP